MMPDERTESFITIPANTQHDLRSAIGELERVMPEIFRPVNSQSSMWESNYSLTPEGGTWLAQAIMKALAALLDAQPEQGVE